MWVGEKAIEDTIPRITKNLINANLRKIYKAKSLTPRELRQIDPKNLCIMQKDY